MGRLSLAIGRHKDSDSNNTNKSKHIRSSLRGFLGIQAAERTSVDLGDVGDKSSREEDSLPPPAAKRDIHKAPKPAKVSRAPSQLLSGGHSKNEKKTTAAITEVSSDVQANDPANTDTFAVHKHAVVNEPASNPWAQITAPAPSSAARNVANERNALDRYSIISHRDLDWNNDGGGATDNNEKSSWRRRGSLLGSRLAGPLRNNNNNSGSSSSSINGGARALTRKESSPVFTTNTATPSSRKPHLIFHRSESSGDSAKNISFWRGVNNHLRASSTHGGGGSGMTPADVKNNNAQTLSSDSATAVATATGSTILPPERTHRSSSVPFLVPVPATTTTPAAAAQFTNNKPMASPYIRAMNAGVLNKHHSHSRLNRKDLSMSLSNTRLNPQDRFPTLSMIGSLEGSGSPPGSPPPLTLSGMHDNIGSAVNGGGSHNTPLTFLVSPRPRANTGARHGISSSNAPTSPGPALNHMSTPSREFRLNKRNLSSSTIPSLDLNLASAGAGTGAGTAGIGDGNNGALESPRGFSSGVDLSEFGVSSSNDDATTSSPKSDIAVSAISMLPPSPLSAEHRPSAITQHGSAPNTPSSVAVFEPVQEEDEKEHTDNQASGRQSTDAVHETHHMEVVHDPHTGRKMINQYMIIRELGRGTHGKVKLAFDTITGEYYAIKVIDKESRDRRLRYTRHPNMKAVSPDGKQTGKNKKKGEQRRLQSRGYLRIDFDKMEKVKREIAILKKCRHPNVVRLREVIDDAHARRIYLVIEYMDGGEIAWRDANSMPVMTTEKARSVFRDLVLGVEYLHYAGVLHRDLKPQNLLCNEAGKVKISDFGVSFLSRRMRKSHMLRSKKEPATASPTGSGAQRTTNATSANRAPPSPLRPFGQASAFQKPSPLHRYASQPAMGTAATENSSANGSLSSRIMMANHGPILQRQGSILSVRQKQHPLSVNTSRYEQLPEDYSSHQRVPIGITNEFGESRTGGDNGMSASPFDGVTPEFKLPPEIMSNDANVYDPFDSSDSDEFFSSSSDSSSVSESDYGEEEDEEDGGIVFGVLPARQPASSLQSPEQEILSEPMRTSAAAAAADENEADGNKRTPDLGIDGASTSSRCSQHQRKGTLGDINFSLDEKDEERELAKTAGTPAFFAPELCCTVEELTKVLRDVRIRKIAQTRHGLRHRNNTSPVAMNSQAAASSMSQKQLTGAEKASRGGGGRPMSLYMENRSRGEDTGGQMSKTVKRHSTIASLFSRPFSPRSRPMTPVVSSGGGGIEEKYEEGEGEEEEELLPANVITPAIDIWAMGVTLYCLIYGRVPFQATTEFELFNVIPHKELEFPHYLEVDEDGTKRRVELPTLDHRLRDLLVRMLDKDFRTRITIEEIKQHPWVVCDLDHPSDWAQETDPTQKPVLEITSQEVEHAVVPKIRRGFRASVRRRISMLSPLVARGSRGNNQGAHVSDSRTGRQQPCYAAPQGAAATKTKSSLDWLKIW